MYGISASTGLLWAAVLVSSLSSCNTPTSESSPSGKATDVHTDRADDGHDHGNHTGHADDGQSDMQKMTAELAKLSPEDAASAEKQHVCPVSGKMLGAMGAPQEVNVNEQQVWICCDACKDQLLKEPGKYLAKLKKE